MSDESKIIARSHNLPERVMAQLPDDEEINPRTAANMRFFQRHPDIWVNIKPNEDAQSCEDAVTKRGQLGSTGVPLHKELKTIASIRTLPNGKFQIVIAHCSADEKLDNAALKEALNTDAKLSRFRTNAIPFGTFSPFLFDKQFIEEELKAHPFELEKKGKWRAIDLDNLDEEQPVLHVFDKSILQEHTWDYMTTNFGHHNLGVQFRPKEIVSALHKDGQAIACHIIPYGGEDADNVHQMRTNRPNEYAHHKIGILTGNSSSSGRLLMAKIEEQYAAMLGENFKGDLSMPDITLRSQHRFGLSMEMNANAHDIADMLRDEAQKLIDDGCTIIALACNTMDVFDDMLGAMAARSGVVYLPIHVLVKDHLRVMEATDVTILGAEPVASLGRWSTYADLPATYTVHETPDIDAVGYAVKNRKSQAEQLEAVRTVFNKMSFADLPEASKPAVIVALTELSEIFDSNPDVKKQLQASQEGLQIIDTMDVYAQSIAEVAVNLPLASRVSPQMQPLQWKLFDNMVNNPRVLREEGFGALTA